MGAMVRIEKARLLFLSGMTFWKIIGLFSDLIPPPPPPPPLPPPLPTTLESLEESSPLSIAANLVTFGVEEEEETLASDSGCGRLFNPILLDDAGQAGRQDDRGSVFHPHPYAYSQLEPWQIEPKSFSSSSYSSSSPTWQVLRAGEDSLERRSLASVPS